MSWFTASLAVTAREQEQEEDGAMCGSSVPIFWKRVLRNDYDLPALLQTLQAGCAHKRIGRPQQAQEVRKASIPDMVGLILFVLVVFFTPVTIFFVKENGGNVTFRLYAAEWQ